ncbi:MAG TPA: long-chain fatty acid--CoA ligase [Ruminococcaceae bacterium]|nr:long-chain fatty acid--CoA ligase [Oscillospiraceae bacterium]
MDNFTAPSVRELLDSGAEKYGDATFIKFIRDGKIEERSFKKVRSDSLAVCRWIRSLSDKRMHIAIIGKSNYEYITCLSGILISGNVAVPFAPDISVQEAAELFERADIEMVLYEQDFAENAEQLKEKCPFLKFAVNLGDLDAFNKIYTDYSDDSEFAHLSDIAVDKNACCVIIFTSGTTGVKKGVELSTLALVGNIMYHDYCTDVFLPNDVSLSVLPMYHIYCFSGDYIKNLKDGLQVCLNGSMMDLIKNLKIFEPKVVRVVPMIAQTLLQRVKAILARNPETSVKDAVTQVFGRNIKWLISGGAYLNPELIDEYEKLGIYLRQGYGMTEAGCRISVPDNTASRESVGRVTDVCTVRIQNGEIQVKTPTVMLGYYKMPEETKKMFTEDGWLKTGDIGELTPDNQLFITGRVKNLIILSSGENVSPEAIEKKFADNQLVSEVLVFAEKDRIIAEIYPDYEYAKLEGIDDIQAELESSVDRMNKTAKPSHIISEVRVRTEPLEKTGSGKIKRKETKI